MTTAPPRPAAPLVGVVPRLVELPVAPLGLRCLARLIDISSLLGLNVVANGWRCYLNLSRPAIGWPSASTRTGG